MTSREMSKSRVSNAVEVGMTRSSLTRANQVLRNRSDSFDLRHLAGRSDFNQVAFFAT